MAKLNGGSASNRVIMEGINTEGMAFTKLSEYIGKEVAVKGYFFTKGRYGEQLVVVSDSLINMPGRSGDEFRSIFADANNKNNLLAGKIKLTNIQYMDTKSGTKTVIYDIED